MRAGSIKKRRHHGVAMAGVARRDISSGMARAIAA